MVGVDRDIPAPVGADAKFPEDSKLPGTTSTVAQEPWVPFPTLPLARTTKPPLSSTVSFNVVQAVGTEARLGPHWGHHSLHPLPTSYEKEGLKVRLCLVLVLLLLLLFFNLG